MLILRNPGQCSQIGDAAVRALALRRMDLLCDGQEESSLGPLVVLELGDRPSQLREPLGFSVFENRFNGAVFGAADYRPSFELVEEHDCCFELVFVLSDDGAGALILVPKAIDVDPQLLALCQRYAVPSQETAP